MPYVPHTEEEKQQMLNACGVTKLESLFDEIPSHLRESDCHQVPEGMNELEIKRLALSKARNISETKCFIGAGAYEHHIPACVWDIAFRGEFLTSYTPYQAEASQGSLQLIYEFQTMMANLTGLEVSNASLYDGASAMAEAILMAVRANRKVKSKRVLVMGALHPHYFDTAHTLVARQGIELISLEFSKTSGITELTTLAQYDGEEIAAVVIPQPNFLGCLEHSSQITNWAHEHNALVIAVVNPMSLALISPPGEWGEQGADIACGEGQPLGIPLASGGPYFGFMTTKKSLVRYMPGRIVGRSVDKDGREAYTLTLQAREQHIRRSKATSNICTNQGLMVTAATIFMSVMGYEGLHRVALKSHHNTSSLLERLTEIEGVSKTFSSPYFHEICVTLPVSAQLVIEKMYEQGIASGVSLAMLDKNLENVLLVCVTETKTKDDIEQFVSTLTVLLREVS